MDTIYVTGHRNPDTDSIVSAMAYAALRNALGDREYQAARLGHVSDETQMVLDRFGFSAPVWVKTMRTQVRDLAYDTPPVLRDGLPVSDEAGHGYGCRSMRAIAQRRGGLCQFLAEDGTFLLRVMLPAKSTV